MAVVGAGRQGRAKTLPWPRLALACALVGLLLTGCASSNDAAKALNPDPPGKMYADAEALLNKGEWTLAAKKYEDLDRDHPYAPEARRAIVMAAYAYYKGAKYPEAITSAQRYTTLHPGTKDAALAHHIIASANFDDIKDPARDQTATRKALAELKVLRQRYPDSPYAKQAENRIRIAEDVLAASEMNVARYYQKQGNQLAAINRYRTVVTDYQTTAHVEEALYRLVETNMVLGIVPEAQSAAAVLGHNYPNSEWYQNAYALLKSGGLSPQMNTGSWISNTLKALTPGGQKKPAPVPQQPAPGLPAPDQLPAPRVPGEDVPTAAKPNGRPPLGFAQSQ
jgi:outer membrane protein assembly factor BamD